MFSARRVTHVMDFGPGGSYGSGKLVSKNVEGLGIAVSFYVMSYVFRSTSIFS